jgi:hypothetical protein
LDQDFFARNDVNLNTEPDMAAMEQVQVEQQWKTDG